jgi:hypothetical protein
MKSLVNSEQFQLYLNIKGYTWDLVYSYHFVSLNRETHPIRYILCMLKDYRIEAWREYAPIQLVAFEFLNYLGFIIRWYEFLDLNMMPREETDKEYDVKWLRCFCGRHANIFGPFLNHILNPFVLDVEVYEGYFIKMRAEYSNPIAAYKERYKPQLLERICRFLLDVAQFLREIPYDDEIKTNLCQNIAFCIESTCGLYDPLESLFEKATPIMIRYLDSMHSVGGKRGPSPNVFEAKRARS